MVEYFPSINSWNVFAFVGLYSGLTDYCANFSHLETGLLQSNLTRQMKIQKEGQIATFITFPGYVLPMFCLCFTSVLPMFCLCFTYCMFYLCFTSKFRTSFLCQAPIHDPRGHPLVDAYVEYLRAFQPRLKATVSLLEKAAGNRVGALLFGIPSGKPSLIIINLEKYFISCDPHHDISRCIFGHIFFKFGQFI